ncbi:Protein kinase C signaling pathway involved MAPKK protein [Entomortierella beljakovae]|nr:Protein kinase C signaling pathway involved MAPKK protein [Entomortierella beljakovae]
MSLARSPATKKRPPLKIQPVAPTPIQQPLMNFTQQQAPRIPTQDDKYTIARGPNNGTQSIRSIPETPGGTRGPDPLNNHVLRPEDIVTIKKLGEGTAGTVSKVKHKPTGFVMARKHVRCDPNPDFQRLLQRELKTLDQCHSPWIVTFYGAYMDDGELAICMEYCEGGSMEAVYKRVSEKGMRIPESILGKIGEAVLNGLVYLHKMHHVIHRDLKPSNIVVTMEGHIKLCDFGVSGDLVNSLAETFVGTSYYMAPERISGGRYPVQSDVWSLGLTMIEIAQMKNPFPDNLTPFDLVQRIVKEAAPSLPEDEPWTADFRHFLSQCLIQDFTKRPTPEQIKEHPFIIKSSIVPEVEMKSWIQSVWDLGSPTAQTPKVI